MADKRQMDYVEFTAEMKQTHTILVPTMLPIHFGMFVSLFRSYGYHAELLTNLGQEVKETGLKYVHNDTCYPAQLMIGQMINALESGGYDLHRVALLISQTGGGCRASNYIALLRKALAKAGMGYIPVISFNVVGLEKHSGFQLTLPLLHRMMYCVTYGDLLMSMRNQCLPYETAAGTTDALVEKWSKKLIDAFAKKGRIRYREVLQNYREIVRDFAALPRRCAQKIRVGIVGEIFVKFSPLGNNELEKFLVSEGAEVVMPGLLDFCMYCVTNTLIDRKLYGIHRTQAVVYRIADRFVLRKQRDLIDAIRENSTFLPPTPFDHTRTLIDGYIGAGMKMGEGWLLTAEMLELIDSGVRNIVCTQPFGCLPNHIVGKGMMKPIKEKNPGVNIVAIDYDAGATKINQENRIKLMLANAAKNEEALQRNASASPKEDTERESLKDPMPV